ncbi:hypothetical protein FH972_010284 [Carpinus fangiana]|uniref:Uncharacterized protein n=1 Tax=Carpinus fangiana TaxID=176857 RepID=A0A660KTX0_9ROSI|nr:hypothetical protein FH972_010284 [Carpinus fangiana]
MRVSYFNFPSPPHSSHAALSLSLSPRPSASAHHQPLPAPSATRAPPSATPTYGISSKSGNVAHRTPPADRHRQRPPPKNRPAERHPRYQNRGLFCQDPFFATNLVS